MKILITGDDSLNRKRLRALLISRGLSDEIPLTEQPRASRCYTRSPIESNIDSLATKGALCIPTLRSWIS